MEYRGISRAKYHRVLDEIVIDSQELLDFYLQFPQECHLPWNEFKLKYNPNNPYRRKLTDDFRQVYAPLHKGLELIEYPYIQDLLKKFNFKNPLTVTDVRILAYNPGFEFKPHIDAEVNWSMFIPIVPNYESEPLVYHQGHNHRKPGDEIYRVYYSTDHPTLTDGTVIHRVPCIQAPRVLLRIRSGDETYNELIDKIDNEQFFNL